MNLSPAMEEAQAIEEQIKEKLFNIKYLQACRLSNDKGDTVKLSNYDLEDRPENVAFVHFESSLDPHLEDI